MDFARGMAQLQTSHVCSSLESVTLNQVPAIKVPELAALWGFRFHKG